MVRMPRPLIICYERASKTTIILPYVTSSTSVCVRQNEFILLLDFHLLPNSHPRQPWKCYSGKRQVLPWKRDEPQHDWRERYFKASVSPTQLQILENFSFIHKTFRFMFNSSTRFLLWFLFIFEFSSWILNEVWLESTWIDLNWVWIRVDW